MCESWCTAAASPLAALAQQSKIARVGALYIGTADAKSFKKELREGLSGGKLSRHNEVAKAMDYMLKRIEVFTRFLDDGRICLSNNAASMPDGSCLGAVGCGSLTAKGGASLPPAERRSQIEGAGGSLEMGGL
jgi:Transposase IS66 family